jgi:hypothetical protein
MNRQPGQTPNILTPSSPTIKSYFNILKPHMIQILKIALADQQEIGWMNFVRGYSAKAWRKLASTHMEQQDVETISDGNRRMGSITQKLHEFIKLTWKGRNDTLHKASAKNDATVRTVEDAEISNYFGHPDLILEHDRHFCKGSLLSILNSKPANCRRWLMQVRQSRAAMLQDKHRQLHITKYFPRTQSTHQHHNKNQKTRITHHATNQAKHPKGSGKGQQVKLTHFFPGRLPDEQNSGHSSSQSLA